MACRADELPLQVDIAFGHRLHEKLAGTELTAAAHDSGRLGIEDVDVLTVARDSGHRSRSRSAAKLQFAGRAAGEDYRVNGGIDAWQQGILTAMQAVGHPS